MSSLFDIGKSGLNSYRQALAVTGQNIANINTDGYKRRDVSLEEVQASQSGIGSTGNTPGLGVRVSDVRRAFDEFLLNKARSAISYAEASTTFSSSIKQLEDIILPGEANIGAAIGRFFSGLQEVANAPSDVAARTVSLEQSKQLAESFNETSALVVDYRNGVMTQVGQAIRDINVLGKELASINHEIMTASGGNQNNSLLDSRDAVIDKLSEYLEVTVDLDRNGAATITLGGNGNGPRLVETNKSTPIGAEVFNGNLTFIMSPGAENIATSQVTNGSLAGLASAFSTAGDVLAEIDNLAFTFVRDVNAVHKRGLNLEGNAGGDLFRAVDVTVVPNPTNVGSASTELKVIDYAKVTSDKVTFTYDAEADIWSGRDIAGNLIASGRNQVTLPGVEITFLGEAKTFDQFVYDPVEGSAAGVSVVIKRPQEFAAASPLIVSEDPRNPSDAVIEATSLNPASPPDLPSITDLFSNNRSSVASTSFLTGGVVATIPANVSNLDIFSLASQSTAKFALTPQDLGDGETLSLTIDSLDSNSQLVQTIVDFNIDYAAVKGVQGDWSDAGKIADLINVGRIGGTIRGTGAATSLAELGGYVSGNEGNLTFSLSENDFSAASVTIAGGTSISGTVTAAEDTASDIAIFTREGRQIAGTVPNETDQETLQGYMTEENGFFEGAQYVGTYLNQSGASGYLGVTATAAQGAAVLVSSEATSADTTITFDALEGINTNEASVDGLSASAATTSYSLTVGSLSATIDGSDIAGPNSSDVATAMISAIRSTAPIAQLVGNANATPLTNETVRVSFEGQTYTITMTDGEPIVSGGETGRLQAFFDSSDRLNIVSTAGSISRSEITVEANLGDEANIEAAARFGLVTNQTQNATSFSSTTAGQDFELKLDGNQIVVTPASGANMPTISFDAKSLAQQRYTLSDLPGEDLIMLVRKSGAKKISMQYDVLPTPPVQPHRDIEIRVTDASAGEVEYFDVETGTSLATRTLDSDQQATARDFAITLNGTLADQDKFLISGNASGYGDNRNLNELLKLQNTDSMGAGSGGFQKVFSATVAKLGAVAQSGAIAAEAANALRDASLEAESEFTGVNLDTEAANLIEQQQAYQASARVLATAREIFDTLIQSV